MINTNMLKELRLKSRKSLQDIADITGLSKAHIWQIEMGQSKNPSMATFFKLSDCYQVSISTLVGENINNLEDEKLITMFRNIKNLKPRDQELLLNINQVVLNHFKVL